MLNQNVRRRLTLKRLFYRQADVFTPATTIPITTSDSQPNKTQTVFHQTEEKSTTNTDTVVFVSSPTEALKGK